MIEQDPPHLMEEVAWLERLALSLVGDRNEAADLAQATWLATLRDGDSIRGSRRAWMVGTLRKLWAGTLRQQKRRKEREHRHQAGRTQQAPSVAELTMRTELHERLLRIVRGLPEHYRGPLLLRYFEDLPPRQIAERLGVPVRSIGTRLHRGLAMVREELDRREPGWTAALMVGRAGPNDGGEELASLATSKSTATALSPAILAMVATVMVSALGLLWWTGSWRTPAAALDAGGTVATAAPGALAPTKDKLARRPLAPRPPTEPSATTSAFRATGKVIDWQQRPVVGATVYRRANRGIRFAESEEAELILGDRIDCAATGKSGAFHAALQERSWLYAEAPNLVLALGASVRTEDAQAPRLLVMAPARKLTLQLRDASGMPVPGVEVRVDLDAGIQARFPTRPEHTRRQSWATHSDSAGTAKLTVPNVTGAWLTTRCRGYRDARIAVADVGNLLTLEALTTTLTGRVIDAAGEPVPEAWVAFGDQAVEVGEDGAFRFFENGQQSTFVTAAAPGWAVHRVDLEAADTVQVVLTSRASRLLGRICDPTGVGLSGLEVSLASPTPARHAGYVFAMETVSAGTPNVWHHAKTDASGRFELSGVAPGRHPLRVCDPSTGAVVVTAPLHSDVQLELRFAPAKLASVHGAVLRPDGQPVRGARVSVQCHRFRIPPADGWDLGPTAFFGSGAETTTDGSGEFVLSNVPHELAWLRVSVRGEAWVERVPLSSASLGADGIQVVLPRAVQFQATATSTDDVTFALLDKFGRRTAMRRVDAISSLSIESFRIRGAQSPVLLIPETAAVVEVRRDGSPPTRVPISPKVGVRLHLRL